MSEKIELRKYYTIKDGEITDLTIRFIGNLNKYIVDYLNDEANSPMHKTLMQLLNKLVTHPINVTEVDKEEEE